jgi:hypothetical protein
LGVEGIGRSYRSTAYPGFGRVYFNIAASHASEPLSPFISEQRPQGVRVLEAKSELELCCICSRRLLARVKGDIHGTENRQNHSKRHQSRRDT